MVHIKCNNDVMGRVDYNIRRAPMTQDWKTDKKRLLAIAKERKYCGLLQETIDGVLEMAKDKTATAEEISLILSEETEERAVVKRMQPMLRAQIAAMEK